VQLESWILFEALRLELEAVLQSELHPPTWCDGASFPAEARRFNEAVGDSEVCSVGVKDVPSENQSLEEMARPVARPEIWRGGFPSGVPHGIGLDLGCLLHGL
jgi:hypothetical protein